MLTGTETSFIKEIAGILNSPGTSNAFKEAFLSTLPPSSRNDENAKTMAENFGSIAAAYLVAIAPQLATAIDNRIKAAGITIVPKSLVCGVGPVSGVISPTDVQIL